MIRIRETLALRRLADTQPQPPPPRTPQWLRDLLRYAGTLLAIFAGLWVFGVLGSALEEHFDDAGNGFLIVILLVVVAVLAYALSHRTTKGQR